MALWLVLAVAASTFADSEVEVYRWVDKDGQVHYSDSPPPEGVAGETIRIESPDPPSGVDPDKDLQKLREQEEQDRQRRLDQQQEARTEKQTRREQRLASDEACFKARMRLELLQDEKPVYRDELGEYQVAWPGDSYQGQREYLDDAAHKRAIEETRRKINANCQNPDDAAAQRAARIKWVRSEYCDDARAVLAHTEARGARVSPEELEEKREAVRRYCED